MTKLNLYRLSQKATGISQKVGDYLAEAAQVCLELNGHTSGVDIMISGLFDEKIRLVWDKNLDKETFLSWKDLKETTEFGSTAIALLLILHFTNFTYVERLPQSGVGDYFLAEEDLEKESPEKEAFLEISGIFEKKITNTINIRINQKIKQLQKKGTEDLNVWITIVEFGTPKAKIIKI